MSGGRRFALLLVTVAALSGAALVARQTAPAAFGESLALRADRIVADSSQIVTNASGIASCVILVNSPLGQSIPITAQFAGDAFYLPSSASATALVFAFPSRGAFVLGDVSAAGSGAVTFWSSQWAGSNVLSGGSASPAFKGFAGTVTLPTSTPPVSCGSAVVDNGRQQPAANGCRPIVHGRSGHEQHGQIRQHHFRQHREDRRGPGRPRLCRQPRPSGDGNHRRHVL